MGNFHVALMGKLPSTSHNCFLNKQLVSHIKGQNAQSESGNALCGRKATAIHLSRCYVRTTVGTKTLCEQHILRSAHGGILLHFVHSRCACIHVMEEYNMT